MNTSKVMPCVPSNNAPQRTHSSDSNSSNKAANKDGHRGNRGNKAKRKENIPRALREQVWLRYMDKKLSGKCLIPWCQNTMTAFDFHVGHNIPESKGGTLDISNLRPICARCNLSMASNYTIDQWTALQGPKRKWWYRFLCI